MAKGVTKQQAKNCIGKNIAARKHDGSVITGKLVAVKGNTLLLRNAKGKAVKTKALLPLVLFDLAAIGTGFGPGYPGFYGYPGVYPGVYPGYFW